MTWNEFQTSVKGQGFSHSQISERYATYKGSTKNQVYTLGVSQKMSWNNWQQAHAGKGFKKSEVSKGYVQYKTSSTSALNTLNSATSKSINTIPITMSWNEYQQSVKGKNMTSTERSLGFQAYKKSAKIQPPTPEMALGIEVKSIEKKTWNQYQKSTNAQNLTANERSLLFREYTKSHCDLKEKNTERIKAENLSAEQIKKLGYERNGPRVVKVVEKGALITQATDLKKMFFDLSGTYTVYVREKWCKVPIPVYHGKVDVIKNRMKSYISDGKFYLEPESKMGSTKNSSLNPYYEKGGSVFVSWRFVRRSKNEVDDIAKRSESKKLAKIDFPLNKMENDGYRAIDRRYE